MTSAVYDVAVETGSTRSQLMLLMLQMQQRRSEKIEECDGDSVRCGCWNCCAAAAADAVGAAVEINIY